MLSLHQHNASLSNLNLRIERHGDERQLAADLKLTVNVAGPVLNDIERGLHESLFRKPAAAGEQPDLIDPALLTAVKFPLMEPVKLSHKFPGYEVEIGDGDEEPLVLADVELKKISAQAIEGGSAELVFTLSAAIDEEEAAELTRLYVREDVVLSMTPPKAQAQQDPDAGDGCASGAANDDDGAQGEAA